MKIVEYKLNIGSAGTFHPPYIIEHAFYDNVSKTYLGVVLDESDRDYWIPDTLVVLTEDEAVERCVSGNVNRVLSPGANGLTDEQLEQAVRDWFANQTA